MFQPIPFTPKHPVLQQHISYYYFLKTDTSDFETRYYAFPHTHSVLNIHQKANFEIKDYYTRVYADPSTQYAACVQGIREYPLLAHLQGQLDKVTILFKPLGINHFISQPFGALYTQPSEVFGAWDNEPEYHAFLKEFYDTDDTGIRANLLESFLMSRYAPFAEYDVLAKSLELLSNFELDLSVETISNQLGLNVRTFNRLLKKHLGVSPVTYKKVARFRHSLQNKIFETGVKRMTDLAYQSNYYDQAYFNKIYRSLTGSNPQRFFNQVNSLADDRLIFQFMKK